MSVTPAFRRFVLVSQLLVLPLAALAQSVTVNIDAAKTVRTVDERVFGLNAVMWDPEAGSAQTITLLQAAGVRTIRVPGGSLSDEYHWNLNRSINRDNPTQNNTWTWASGFNKFAGLITGLDAQAFVTVNYGSGTPEEAAAWVAYANAGIASSTLLGTDAKGADWRTAGSWASVRATAPLATDDGMNFLRVSRATPYALKYWEIGNECYGAAWETDLQDKRHDPTTYATRAKDYIAKMKAVDPTIKVGVVVVPSETEYANGYTRSVTNPRTQTSRTGWTPVMLTTLRELGVTPDFVIYHRYEQAPASDQPNNPENDASLLQKAKTWPDDAAAIRRQLADYLGTAGAAVEIVVTENNSVYSNPGKQSTSLVNGLYLADSIGQIMQTEINGLMWWDTRNGQLHDANNSASLYGWRNYGDYGILSTPSAGGSTTYYEAYPTYYVTKLLSKFARGGDTVVTATSASSLLTVFAVKSSGGDLRLLVLNKDAAATTSASISLAGFTPGSAANVYTYGKTQDDAAKPGGSGATDPANTTMNVSGATFTASFAPYSATVISIPAGTATPTPPPPTTPPPTTPPPSSGGGGGGGGAPSLWFIGALVALSLFRWNQVRR
jgi:alpha-N-arabinofuranosidase